MPKLYFAALTMEILAGTVAVAANLVAYAYQQTSYYCILDEQKLNSELTEPLTSEVNSKNKLTYTSFFKNQVEVIRKREQGR